MPTDTLPPGFEPAPDDASPDALPPGFEPEEAAPDDAARLGALHEAALTRAPDAHARTLSLARESGAAPDVVEANPEGFERARRVASFSATDALRYNPHVARAALDNPAAAPVLLQDERLHGLTQAFRFLKAQATSPGKNPDTMREVYEEEARALVGEPAGFLGGFSREQQEQLRAAGVFEKAQERLRKMDEEHLDAAATPRKVPTVRDALADDDSLLRLPKLVGREYERARAGVEYAHTGAAILARKRAGADVTDLETRATALEQEMVARDYSQGPWEQLALDAASLAGSQVESLKGLAAGTGVGAAAGYALGMATRAPPAARRLMAETGAKWGGRAGAFTASFEMEMGGAYLELRRETTDDGQVVDENLAAGAALLYGLASAGVETASLPAQLKAFGGVGDALASGSAKPLLQRALRNAGLRALLTDAGKRWLKGAASEGTEEAVQQLLNDATAYAARSLQAGELQEGNVGDALERAVEAGGRGFTGSLVVGSAGAGVNVSVELYRQGQARRAAAQVKALQELKDSPSAQAAPGLVAELIERTTEETGEAVTHLYVDAGAFVRFHQESDADPAAAAEALLGEGGGTLLQEAVAAGGRLEVPVAVYLERLRGTPAEAALAEDMTTRPWYATARELGDVDAQAQAFLAGQEAGAAAQDAAAEAAPQEAQREAMVQGLVESGRYTPAQARLAVELWDAVDRTAAQRSPAMARDTVQAAQVRVRATEGEGQGEGDASFDFGANATPEALEQARAIVAFLPPEQQAVGKAFLAYATGEGDARPANVPAALERRLAELGVVDPQGYAFDEAGRDLSRPMAARGPRRSAEEYFDNDAGELGRAREQQREHLDNLRGGKRLRQDDDADVPAASRALAERLAKLTPEERAAEYFLDSVTGLRNRRAWDATPIPEGKVVGILTSPDVKGINDDVAGGHDTANGLLRVIGRAAGEGHPEAARQGTNVLLHVADEGELGQVLERVRAALPAGLRVEGAVAPTTDAAFTALDASVGALRTAGTLGPRGSLPAGVEVGALSFGEERAAGAAPAELVAPLGKLPAPDYFRATYLDKDVAGILSREGWEATPRRAAVASLDLRGLKAINDALGKPQGDAVLQAFGAIARELGASDFDFAHLSGDEYAAQADSPAEMQAFLAELAARAQDVGAPVVLTSGETVTVPVLFRHGVGATYGEADRDLNARKRAEAAAPPDAGGGGGAEAGGREGTAGRDVPGRDGVDAGRAAGEGGRADGSPAAPRARRGGPQRYPGAGRQLEQPAFHGSPRADIERLSTEFVGTGSGHATHGWGLYFYQDAARADLARDIMSTRRGTRGRTYSVEVPEDGHLLDHDAPLARQPRMVLGKLEAAGLLPRGTAALAVAMQEGRAVPATPIDAAGTLLEQERDGAFALSREGLTGRELYERLVERTGSPKAASAALRDAGIPGARFRDLNQDSAPRGFVVWDDDELAMLDARFRQDDEDEGAPAPRGYIDLRRDAQAKLVADIVLNAAKADRSTFFHETGHAFLELLGDMAAHPDAPAQVREDYATLLQGIGAKDRASIAREHHEKLARMFEAYLYEGKAPSAALARAFRRISLWLRQVYRSLRSLNVELSDDVRGVFDRLLATDEEIARQKQAMALKPLFRSPEEAGMTPEQWQAHLEAMEKATSASVRALEVRVLRDQLRETEAWWKEEERALRGEADAAWDTRQDVRAWRAIRKGELVQPDGTVVRLPEVGRVDLAAAAELLGGEAEAKKLLGPKAVKTGGAAPDDVAALFGYPDGRALFAALQALPERRDWVKAEASRLMAERHPDILAEKQALAEAAGKALHSDATGSWLVREWAALRKKAGVQGDPPVEAIRRAAELMVEKTSVRRLNAYAALQAEGKKATEAALAAARGDFRKAYVLQQQRLLNHFAYRELLRAREAREDFEELAATLRKDKARARLGKASPAFRDGVDFILERLGLKAEEVREAPLAGLATAIAAVEASGGTVAFDVEVVEKALGRTRDWRDLTVAELAQVHGALKNLKQAARNVTTSLVDGRRVEKAEVVAALVAEAAANLPSKGAFSSSPAAESLLEKGLGVVASIDGSLLRPEVMAGWLGAGDTRSMWFRALVAPFQRAKALEADLLKRTVAPIMEALERLPASARARMREHVDGQALFPTHRTDIRPPSRRFELLAMALHMGTGSNKQRLLEGRGITEAQVLGALDLLTKEEMDWVQSVWDANESLWPLARELEERDAGLAPPKQLATPVVTRHGTYRGGYHPAIYDRRVEPVGEKQAAQTVADLMDASYTRPGTARSHLKRRADNFAGVLSLDLSTIHAHLAQVTHDIAFREAVKSVGALVLDREVAAAMKERLGDERSSQFLQWVKDVGNMRGAQVGSHTKALTRVINGLRQNFVVGTLGWAADVALGDVSNLVLGLRGVSRRYWAAGLAEFARHPVRTYEEARRLSGELRARDEREVRAMEHEIRKLTERGLLDRVHLAWYRDAAFAFMEATDRLFTVPLWMGAYRQALARGRTQEAAVVEADAKLRAAFPGGSAVDKPGLLRDKGFWGATTVFYGYMSTLYQRQRDIVQPLLSAEGPRGKLRTLPAVAGGLMATWLWSSVLAELLTGRGPEKDDGEDEEERWEHWTLRKMALAPLQSLPLPVASVVESFVMGKKASVRAAPGFAFVEPLARALVRVASGEGDAVDDALTLARALGPLLGLPSRPVRSVEYVVDALDGESPAEDPADVASGLVHGYREGQPANAFRPGAAGAF